MNKSDRVHKRGDVRADGYVFWAYGKRNGKVRECWLSPEAVQRARMTAKVWKSRNPERHRAHSRRSVNKWRQSHPERAARTRENYVTQNIERIREKDRQRLMALKIKGGEPYRKLLERSRELNRLWVKANPDKQAARMTRRRARLSQSIVSLTKDEAGIARAIYKCCRRISTCTGFHFHVDHITPLAKGGPHHPSNLQILPAVINLRKGTKTNTQTHQK